MLCMIKPNIVFYLIMKKVTSKAKKAPKITCAAAKAKVKACRVAKKAKPKKELSPYAQYVKDHLTKELTKLRKSDKSAMAKDAMRVVAAKWRAKK
jgi:hypothetical protein